MFENTVKTLKNIRTDITNIRHTLQSAERITILDSEIKNYKEKFVIEQAELKMKNKEFAKENKDALTWAQDVLDKTESHVKQDILKFKTRIEQIDKQILDHEQLLMMCKIQYDDVSLSLFLRLNSLFTICVGKRAVPPAQRL